MKASWIVLVSLGLLTGGERPGPTSLEAQGAKITVSTKRVGKFDTGCAAFLCRLYLRIENTTSNPLDPGLGGSYLQREDGKALRALTAEEATEAMGYGMTHGKLGALVGATTGMHEPRQAGRAYGPAIVQQWFVFGPIPPNSYREGIVYFEGSGKARPKGLLLRLPGLLQEGVARGLVSTAWRAPFGRRRRIHQTPDVVSLAAILRPPTLRFGPEKA